jgi:hypothetical protein
MYGAHVSEIPLPHVNGSTVGARLSVPVAALGMEVVIESLGPPHDAREIVGRDIVQEWGEQSFPAGDPPANW